MRKHTPRWLNDVVLCGMGGSYEGVINAVVEERVRNLFKRDETGKPLVMKEPVIVFADGWRLVPNISMRRVLIDAFGSDSDQWIGRRLIVDRHRMEGTAKWQKRVKVGVASALDVPAWVTENETDVSEPMGTHDEDDIDPEASRFARRRG